MKRGKKPYNIELLIERGIFPENWKEIILDLGRQGKNKLDYAIELGISRHTLYRLMERSDEFASTINQALELSEKWFIDVAVKKWGEDGAKTINTTFMKYYLQNVYRDSGWVDRTDITTDGKAITPDNKIEIEIIKSKNKEDDSSKNGQ